MPMHDKITTPEGLARFLVALGYDDSAIVPALRKRHPDTDAEQLLADARAQQATSDKQLEADLDREAVEQEHRP